VRPGEPVPAGASVAARLAIGGLVHRFDCRIMQDAGGAEVDRHGRHVCRLTAIDDVADLLTLVEALDTLNPRG
jgi:hypothetical protein